MAKPQFVWDGNDLDNGTTRIIDRPPSIASDPTGLVTLVVDFVIEADSAEALQTLYLSTLADFQGQNKAFSYTLNDDASNFLLDVTPFSSSGMQTGCAVSIDDTRTFSKYGMALTLLATTIRPTPTGGGGSGFENASLKTVTTYTAARVDQVQVTGPFYPTDGLTAREAYDAARESILTDMLLVNADGSRNDTSGMALITEVIEDEDGDGGAVSVLLSSEWQEPVLSSIDGVRRVSLHVRSNEAENWQKITAGGLSTATRPTFYSVAAEVEFDRGTVATLDALKEKAGEVRAKVLASVKSLGAGSVPIFLRYENTFNASSNKIVVAAVVQGGSNIIEFRISTTKNKRYNFVAWPRGKNHYAQASAAPADVVITVAIHLKSKGGLSEEALRDIAEGVAPTEAGFTYITGTEQLSDEPEISGEYGDGFNVQRYSVSWGRFRLRGSTFAAGTGGTFVDPQEA